MGYFISSHPVEHIETKNIKQRNAGGSLDIVRVPVNKFFCTRYALRNLCHSSAASLPAASAAA